MVSSIDKNNQVEKGSVEKKSVSKLMTDRDYHGIISL